MCDHDGTATRILRYSTTRPGMLDPALLSEACETIMTQFAPLRHRCTRAVPCIAAVQRNRRRGVTLARFEHTTLGDSA